MVDINNSGCYAKDPEIIDYCKDNGRVWITHDTTAKKVHEEKIKVSWVSVLWIRGRTEYFASWVQFKVIVRVWDRMNELLRNSHGAMHFEAGVSSGPTPKVSWTENSQDRSRNTMQ